MVELIKRLCCADGVSGDEGSIRDIIISEIENHCEYSIDALGNIIAFKKGKKQPTVKLMIDAHTDEVGFIITDITDNGFLKFKTVGGINTEAMLSRRVRINGSVIGVIGSKPIHLVGKDETAKLPKADSLYIDIGLCDKSEALQLVSIGDRGVLLSDFCMAGDKLLSKALDDRLGCAVLVNLLKSYDEYDFYATFTVQEEVGLRGAKTAAFKVNPDAAIMIDSTTASDIAGIPEDKTVSNLGKGAVVSFMDRATLYDRDYYNAAINSGITCQPKRAVAGGNNAGAVHLSREGVRSLAISTPCRYIHSAASVADINDVYSVLSLTEYMIDGICGGSIK